MRLSRARLPAPHTPRRWARTPRACTYAHVWRPSAHPPRCARSVRRSAERSRRQSIRRLIDAAADLDVSRKICRGCLNLFAWEPHPRRRGRSQPPDQLGGAGVAADMAAVDGTAVPQRRGFLCTQRPGVCCRWRRSLRRRRARLRTHRRHAAEPSVRQTTDFFRLCHHPPHACTAETERYGAASRPHVYPPPQPWQPLFEVAQRHLDAPLWAAYRPQGGHTNETVPLATPRCEVAARRRRDSTASAATAHWRGHG